MTTTYNATPVPIVPSNPLRNYQFKIVLLTTGGPSVVVGGVQRVSGLGGTIGAYEVWEGGNNLHRYANPDKLTWDPVTLEQGILLDNTLEEWALGVRHFVTTGELMTSKTGGGIVRVKRNVEIEVWDLELPDPTRTKKYTLYNAWISKFSALPKLDGLGNEIALLTAELVHEGWTKDSYQNV